MENLHNIIINDSVDITLMVCAFFPWSSVFMLSVRDLFTLCNNQMHSCMFWWFIPIESDFDLNDWIVKLWTHSLCYAFHIMHSRCVFQQWSRRTHLDGYFVLCLLFPLLFLLLSIGKESTQSLQTLSKIEIFVNFIHVFNSR